ncbi:O-antigen/teichoic acid export membrane protein [Mucilaginibacter frigoritolerans]|uniref:O-antigen/teichoic acid export membrane protein n=1 Tax=Mucilaginibacter frigoritolerans TaxID=652788 RepID=A0A562TRA6_9SPHI|nr:flippase [Mucilaginibacter frigoritolerans]TWI95626.1 O-antigen/teichoic acid export membrane protein [Mucilaginibacter frigoritolerans]
MSTVKKNYIFNLLLTGFNILFPVISFPYAAKILGPVGIGKVQFILSFTQYFALIAALGIPIYGVRLISQSAHDSKLVYKNLGELLSIHIFCSLLITVLYIIVVLSFPFFHDERTLYILSGLIILMSFSSVDWYFSGIEDFKLIAIRSVSVKILSLICLFFFVKVKSDYNIYLIISLVSILGNNIINIISIARYVSISYKGIRKHIKPLAYTFGTTVATSMYTMLDTILIGFFADDKAVGLYSASIKLTKISIPLILSAGAVLMPRISKFFAGQDAEALKLILNKAFNYVVILAVPVCIGLLFLAPQLIYVFSGIQFNEAILTMQILSPLALIIALGNFWGFQILIPAGKEREVLISVVLGMIFNLSLNCIMIPVYKQNGAAVANVISELIVTSAYMFFCFRVINFKISHKPILLNLLACVPFIIIVLFFRTLNLNAYCFLGVSAILFVASYFVIQLKLIKSSVLNELLSAYYIKSK